MWVYLSAGCGSGFRFQLFLPRVASCCVFVWWQLWHAACPLSGFSSLPPSVTECLWSASVAVCVQFGPCIWQTWLSRLSIWFAHCCLWCRVVVRCVGWVVQFMVCVGYLCGW